MLLHPSTNALDSCSIAIKKNLTTQWSHLEIDGTWLFTTTTEERLRISYPRDIYENAKIQGIGILRLASGCSARTASVTLIAKDVKISKVQYIYEPETCLNVTYLFPILEDNATLECLPEVGDTGPLSSWTTHKLSLKSIAARMDEIGRHSRTSINAYNLTYRGLTIQAIIIVGFTVFVGMKLCRRSGRPDPNALIAISTSPNLEKPTPPHLTASSMLASRSSLCPVQTAETD